MLIKGTENKPYEQYGASPSIDYPSPVKSVGNIKNILDMSNAKGGTSGGITCTMNKDGSYQYVGTATSTVVNVWMLGKYGADLPGIFTLEAGTYYINDAYIFAGTSALNADVNKKIYTFINEHKITGVRVPAAVSGNTYDETKYPIIAKIDHEIPWVPYDCGYAKVNIQNKNIAPIFNLGTNWKYTDKGWFCYELCVPEPPEVTEIVDGSCLVRIKPLSKEQREMSERCVQGLGYQGNNLLCSNWDTDHMEKLDYNGIYEYLYAMKHQKAFDAEDYSNGIPKEEFESLIMEYLPVTAEQIQEYAVFDEKNQTYVWVRLGCLNYAPTFFGTSLPEVIDIKENEDGTVTLTVDAVCDMVICDDAVITHELTVKFADDGSLQYLGNEILNDGIMHIPDYQYRIRE